MPRSGKASSAGPPVTDLPGTFQVPACSLTNLERMLTATPALVWGEVQGMPPALQAWRSASAAWSALEIIGHLIEADMRVFLKRILLLRSEPGAIFEPWDPDLIAAARADATKDAQSLVDEFARVRRLGVGVVRGLTPADLAIVGHHPDVGGLSVANLLAEWVAHDRAHLAQLGEITRLAMLPGMGHAARFGHAAEMVARWEKWNCSS